MILASSGCITDVVRKGQKELGHCTKQVDHHVDYDMLRYPLELEPAVQDFS